MQMLVGWKFSISFVVFSIIFSNFDKAYCIPPLGAGMWLILLSRDGHD